MKANASEAALELADEIRLPGELENGHAKDCQVATREAVNPSTQAHDSLMKWGNLNLEMATVKSAEGRWRGCPFGQ